SLHSSSPAASSPATLPPISSSAPTTTTAPASPRFTPETTPMPAEPLLPTSVIGSWAWPAWLHTALAASERGEYGPDDVLETQDAAVDLALRDQEDAGIDMITDGEMRRAGFFTAAFYGHLTGIRELPPRRRVGLGGHDQRESYEVVEPLKAPDGLGIVAEYQYARRRTTKALKVT